MSLLSTSLPTLIICCLFDDSCSDRCEVISYCDLDFISLLTSDAKHFSYLLWKNVYSSFLPTFRWVFFLIILTLMSSLYILETNPFSDGFDITFSHSVDYLFICGWLPWLCKRKHSRAVCMHPVALMGDLDMEWAQAVSPPECAGNCHLGGRWA